MSPPQHPGPRQPPFTFRNTAERDVNVGFQAENIFGDVTYTIGDNASPEDKFRVAKKYIAGGRSRSAEELIGEVVAAGFVAAGSPSSLANEVAYYWTLSVLGDRSFELLDKGQFEQIRQARELACGGPADQWHRALGVLTDLLDALETQEESGSVSPERLDAFFAGFGRLEPVHREEIRRHLDLILSGVFQDRLTAHDAEMVRTERMGRGREERVWKFFEPVPARPRQVPVQWPALELLQWTMAGWGAIMVTTGLVLGAFLVATVSWKAVTVSAVLLLGFGSLVGYVGPRVLPVRYAPAPRRDPKESRGRPASLERHRFAEHVHRTVRRQYEKRSPRAALQRPLWTAATRRSRARLAHEIIEVYGDAGIAPSRIDWLIAWHAEKDARGWSAGKRNDPRPLLRIAGLLTGVIGMAVGSHIAMTKMQWANPEIADIALAWVVAGGVLLVVGRADVHIVRSFTHRAWQTKSDERFAREKEAYEERCRLLANRPGDAEMARWLDFDKFYLKSLAMNQYGLGNREVVAHAFLAEAVPNCRRARVSNGPSRFSAYTIWVFLLTGSGVRQMAVHLDFPTGIVKDQQRRAFRYDALASAQTTEFGIRFDDGRRERLLPPAPAFGDDQRREERETERGEEKRSEKSFVFFQLFQLSLVNGQNIHITVENLEEWLLRRVGEARNGSPFEMPDTSDLTGALGVLEAVAADGSEWITRARARRRNASSAPEDRSLPGLPPPRRPSGGSPADSPAPETPPQVDDGRQDGPSGDNGVR
ncbi:hypothetical protein [Actinomadura sp. WMMA1423]|uniref:hypothetical protein n=1 Tax=Actinomadura sp. WMMA1423 TaxID=2591108 RepID=UPI0011479567|nr:hypothetical protein [Actinomadura sp. WMMA1423]